MPRRPIVIGVLSIVAGVALIAYALVARARFGLAIGTVLGVLLIANGALRMWLAGRQRPDDKM